MYKAIRWAAAECVNDLSSLGAGSYCSICRDASRGCAAMSFSSMACSFFNLWADVQRMRARNDHNCIKAIALVSNVLGFLQLVLAVSIFQLLCVAEFPLQDADQTFQIELRMGKGGALIASACCINMFSLLVHWLIPVPEARWNEGAAPSLDLARELWPPLRAAKVFHFDGALPHHPPQAKPGGWVGHVGQARDMKDDPAAALIRAGQGHSDKDAAVHPQDSERRQSLESV
ncbi:unnamed protein product [Effrenium voratum]|nr:unnamed protein product [Effrenium voratum]